MPTLNDYVDITPGAELSVEFDYVNLDTESWLSAVARDVTDYWSAIVERVTDSEHDPRYVGGHCVCPGMHVDGSHGAARCARDRVVSALWKRAENLRYGRVEYGRLDGWTGNSDSLFDRDFTYSVAPLIRDGYIVGWLIFVTIAPNGYDLGLDYVYQVDSFEDAIQVITPQIGYCCGAGHEEAGDSRSGYSWQWFAEDGSYLGERTAIIKGGRARCSRGHFVSITVREDF